MGMNLWAGNPDRQGQAGAFELLINPFARSSGFHSLNTANATGLEALRLNVAGLSKGPDGTEIIVAHTQWLSGTGIGVNFVGLAQSVGESGVLGIELMSMNFGEIPITTTSLPEGGIGTFSPTFTNLAVAYSVRFSETILDVRLLS